MSDETVQKENNGHLTEANGTRMINGFPYLPKNERKKILLLSDDL